MRYQKRMAQLLENVRIGFVDLTPLIENVPKTSRHKMVLERSTDVLQFSFPEEVDGNFLDMNGKKKKDASCKLQETP